MGEHDLAALATMALVVGLARLFACGGRPPAVALVAHRRGHGRDRPRRVAGKPARSLPRRGSDDRAGARAPRPAPPRGRRSHSRSCCRGDCGNATACEAPISASCKPGSAPPPETPGQYAASWSQRLIFVYIGGRVFLDHPVLGTGWEGELPPSDYAEYLPDARERYSDQPPHYFPQEDETFIPQQTYDQVLYQLGLVGAALFLVACAHWQPAAPRSPADGRDPASRGPSRRSCRWHGCGAIGGAIAGAALFGGCSAVRALLADARGRLRSATHCGGAGVSLSIVHVIARLNVGGAALHVLQLAREQSRRGHDVIVVAGTLAAGRGVDGVRRRRARRPARAAPGAAARAVTAGRLGRDPRAAEAHPTTTPGRASHPHREGGCDGSPRRPRRRERTSPRPCPHLPRPRPQRLLQQALGAHLPLDRASARPHVRHARRRQRRGARRSRRLRRRTGTALRRRSLRLRPAGVGRGGRRSPAARSAPRSVPATTTFVVGWAGRLTAIKRPLDLVHTLRALVDPGVDALLVLVGDGEDRGAVEALAAELGVADRCRFVGFQKQIRPWYAAFDALILTSANEGTPVVAIEALAAGRPVVATRAGGTGAVVRDGETGYLEAIGDTDALAERLATLGRDPELRRRMGARGARTSATATPSTAWPTRSRRSIAGCSSEGPAPPQAHRCERVRGSPPGSAPGPARARASTHASSGSTCPAATRRASTKPWTRWASRTGASAAGRT